MRRCLAALLLLTAATAAAQRHPNVAKGIDPSQSHGTGTIDTINHFNGALSLRIPTAEPFPLSSRLSYSLAAYYNSTVWDIEEVWRRCATDDCPECVCPYTAAYPDRRSNCGMGWTLHLGRLWSRYAVTNETGYWVWESPNGSDHQFRETLHSEDTATTETWYTRDGTFLRMRLDSATGRRIIEFPDGTMHEYEPGPDGAEGVWRLAEIHDHFKDTSGAYVNWMRIAYTQGADGATDWKITDSIGRTHYVDFIRLPYDSGKDAEGKDVPNWDFVDYVAFGVTLDSTGAVVSYKAKYDFTYEQKETARHSADDDRPIYGGLDDHPAVQGLTQVKLVDSGGTDLGHTFDLTYAWAPPPAANDDWSGVVTSAILPTRAKVQWSPDWYHMPSTSADEDYYTVVKGIHTRTLTEPVSGIAQWTYTESTDRPYSSPAGSAPRELKNTVQDPRGNTTEYYFNVITDYDATWKPGHYGLPVSPLMLDSDNERYLSVRRNQSGAPKRSRYLRYEHDTGTPGMDDPRNMRVVSERTDFHDDVVNSAAVYATADYTDYDGLGHYRRVTSGGSFSSGNVRETFTNYNPARGTYPSSKYSMLPATDEWLLGAYSEMTATEGTSSLRTQFCFDVHEPRQTGETKTGKLRRRRTLAVTAADANGNLNPGATDVLEVFSHDAAGNVNQHDTYGGDGATLATTADVCSVTLPTVAAYRIAHTHSNGVPATSTYKDPANDAAFRFKSLNLTIDRDTGLPLSSTDTAGRVTSYTYDAARRVKTIAPPGEAATAYTYANATLVDAVFTPAHITITTGSETSRIESQQQFDGLGRFWREKKLMSDGSWSVQETLRNTMGWITSVSELERLTYDAAAGETEFDYVPAYKTEYSSFDALGRPALITAPDSKQVNVSYKGVRQTTQTRSVATSATAETSVSATQEFDRQGRLYKVTENSGSSTAWVATTYGHDAAGHVTSVTFTSASGATQPDRTFSYDGRGFLTSETQPESGTTTYEYDARGHVTLRDAPDADLTFQYDKAERLKQVDQAGAGVMKEFVYDRTNDGTDYSMGKLDYAIRHNHHAILGGDITIKETYTYKGVGGRLSSKKTEVSPGGQTFADGYTFNSLGALQSVSYPKCTGCSGLADVSRSVSNTYSYGFLTAVPTYANSLTYHANGLLATIRHLNGDGTDGPLYSQTYASADGMPRPSTISVSGFCKDFLFTEHPESTIIQSGQSATLTASAAGATSYSWFTNDGTQIAGTTSSITVTPSVTTTYYARATNGSCTVDSASATVTVEQCPPPDATITAAAAMDRGSTGTASVPATTGATYAWTIANGTITAGSGTEAITFVADCGGTSVRLDLTVTASCGASTSSAATIALNAAATATVDGEVTISQGESAEIAATLTGSGPWTIQWQDEQTPRNASSSLATRIESPLGSTTYHLSSVTDTYGCAGTVLGDGYVVTVIPPAPTAVSAAAVSSTRVDVTWSFSGTEDWFEVDRRAGGGYVTIATTTAQSYSDTSAVAGTAYLYRVRAVKSNTSSAASAPDLATTVIFADDPLVSGQSLIRAQHIADLRTAVNAVRATAGLSQTTFTDGSLAGVEMKTVHIQELRAALDQARSTLALGALTYSDQPLAAGVVIKRAHVEELRGGVK